MERIWLKSYPKGVPGDIDPGAYGSLGEFFAASVELYRDRVAFVSMGRRITFGELDLLSRAFASYLRNVAKLEPGARVALMMPNLLQYPVALFGALRAGCVVVNCNPLYSPRELRHQLEDSGASVVVVLENFAQTLERASEGGAVRAIVTSAGDMLGLARGALANFVLRHVQRAVPAWKLPQAGRFNHALALGGSLNFEAPRAKPDDLAFLQYTGGTTGVPKGAMLTHRNMIANLQQTHAWLSPSLKAEGEFFVTALPLYHVFALTANCFVPVMIGATNLLIANPRNIRAFVGAMRKSPFTVITGVNTLFNALLNDPEFLRLDFSRLRLCVAGGMAVQRPVAERWKAATGRPLIEGYGLTETSPIVTANPFDIEEYTGTIGLPLPSTDISIRDAQGNEQPVGEAGELCVKGPQVMAGYWKRPDETAKVMTADGFLRTGDIARVDERGYVTIVDRAKDMIIVSGFNVYPNEIEDVVMAHESVSEVGAVGVPDARSGEAVKIVVVRKDASLTEAELIAHCRERLTAYKTPRHVEFRDTLPRTPIGKVLRRALRETAVSEAKPEGETETAN